MSLQLCVVNDWYQEDLRHRHSLILHPHLGPAGSDHLDNLQVVNSHLLRILQSLGTVVHLHPFARL